MNLTNGKGSMSVAAGSGSWKSGDLEFPAGLRVLVVDDDPTCLMILERMLKQCLYEVTKCNRAENALSMLREKKNGFDIVLSDVHMPDMDGFKLLEHIGLEMDLPVIMMSADDGKHVVMKGVTHGACDYLIKPIRIEALKNIWQHVVRKRKNEWKELEQSGSVEEGDRQQKPQDDVDYSSSVNEGNWKNTKRRKEEEEEAEERDDTSTLKKPRVVWSVELHQQFVAAVNQLGIDKAVPKKILELMNVPGLTRENVASHLQKYRLYLRRISGVSQHQGGVNGSFIGTQDATYGQMSSFNGLDLQALAVAGQLPAQSLATLQAAGFGRAANKPGIPIPLIDQRNVFSFDNPKLRFGDGQQQHIMAGNKQVNLLHGIPTTVERKQLVNLPESTQSFANTSMQVHSQGAQSSSLLMNMAQPQSRGQILSDNMGSQIPRLPMNVGQPFMSNDIACGVLSRNGTSENGRGAAYNASQPMSTSNLPLNHGTELPTSTFPLGNAPVLPSLTSKGSFHDNINPNMKGQGAFLPSYDILGDLQHIRSHDWDLPNVGLAYDASQQASNVQGNLDPSPPSAVHSGFSSSPSIGQNRNHPSPVGKPVFLPEGTQQGNMPNDGQQLNSLIGNPVRIKSEAISDSSYPSLLYPEHIGQEDLMSVLLKQQQQSIGSTNAEFNFDGYSIDGIPD